MKPLLSFPPGRRPYGPEAEAPGPVTSNASAAGGMRPLPVLACASLRRARGSPSRRSGSGSGLPPVTAEEDSLPFSLRFRLARPLVSHVSLCAKREVLARRQSQQQEDFWADSWDTEG